MDRFKICSALCLLLLSIAAGQIFGQEADRAQLTREQFDSLPAANGLENGRAVSTPNDSDLGVQEVLKPSAAYQPFWVTAGTPVYYTSNAGLTHNHEQSDVVTAPGVGLYYQPRLTDTLYGLVDARQQLFYYGDHHKFDFGSLDVEAGLMYLLPQFHDLILRGEYDFNRLTPSDRLRDEFFQNHSIILNAEVPFRISQSQQLSLGGDVNLSVAADHQSPRRNDYGGYASYSIYLTRDFSLNGLGRVVVRDYHQNDRTDVSEILSVVAVYQLTPWWNVSAIGTFARSDSNHDVFDYSVANVGGAMAFSIRF